MGRSYPTPAFDSEAIPHSGSAFLEAPRDYKEV